MLRHSAKSVLRNGAETSLACIVHQNMNRTEAGARCVKGAMEFLRFADIRLRVMEMRIVSKICWKAFGLRPSMVTFAP